MKKLILITLVAFIFNKSGHSQEHGRVYLMRFEVYKEIISELQAYRVFIDDTLVCKLNNHRYSVHEVEPGKHKFSAQQWSKKSTNKSNVLTIDIEPKKNYYVQLYFYPNEFSNRLMYCLEITEDSAFMIIPALHQDEKCLQSIESNDDIGL